MKKLSLIIIISILAYSQVGYYFVWRHSQSVQKEAIKQKILGQLKDAELKIITFSANKNIYWEEEGKEFLFNGEMYDVVKMKTVNGNVTLYCINDKKEKALVDNCNLLTKNNSSDKKEKNIDNSLNLFAYQDENKNDSYFIFIETEFHSTVSYLTEGIDDTVSPPPKAA